MTAIRSFETPREGDLGLRRIANAAGLSIERPAERVPLRHRAPGASGADARQPDPGLAARRRHRPAVPAHRRRRASVVEAVGPGGRVDVAAADDRFVWEGATARACGTG